jgi:hypothetical protein
MQPARGSFAFFFATGGIIPRLKLLHPQGVRHRQHPLLLTLYSLLLTSYSLLFTSYFLLFTLYLARLSAPSAPDEIFFAKSLVGLKKITLFAKKLLKQIFVTYKIRASDIYT